MRVLFLCELWDPKVGSSTRQAHHVAARLRELGHETALVGTTARREEVGETEIEGLRVFRIFSDYPVRFRSWVALRNPMVTRPFARILESWRPDVVHAHLLHTHLGYHSLTQARRAGAGVVFTAHDVMVFCYQKLTCFHGGEEQGGERRDYRAHLGKCVPCQRFRFRPGRNRAIRRVLERDVHRFTVVSDELGRAIAANGIRVDATVHNAIRPRGEPVGAEAVAAFRERYGLTGKRVIAMGGRLHEQKGVLKLLEMLARLLPDLPDLRLLVLGETALWGAFEPAAERLGVADRVVATGWLAGDDLAAAYAAVDVFVTPSICFDTFGIVNLEAMEQARPLVVTLFGGGPEVVADGQSGYVANPFDVAAFAGRIRALLEDEPLRRRMGEEGLRRLRERFTIERLAEDYLSQYGLALARVAEKSSSGGGSPPVDRR